MNANSNQKDVIYVDIDDEITSLIDKVKSSDEKIVALVLPRRATMLQSVVNMKLLKKAADDIQKRVVLITSEAGLTPLAGAVGLHVAKTLQSKPAVPAAPTTVDSSVEVSDSDISEADVPLDPSAPVGELANMVDDEEETIEIDNSVLESASAAAAASAATDPKKIKNKGVKIPDFNKFRLRIILGVAALLVLIIGWYLAAVVMPKAQVTIRTDSSRIPAEINLTASPAAKELDEEKSIVPATSKQYKKTDSVKVATTGEKNMGEKATGTVSLKNCTKTDGAVSVPAGTSVITSNFTYVTEDAVTLPASSFTGGGSCITSTKDVEVTASQAGEQYNVASGRNFTVAGYSGVSGTNAEAFAGGTNKMVKVVAQADVDNAKQKLQEQNTDEAKTELAKQFKADEFIAIVDSLSAGTPSVSSSPNVGDEATEVTVTSTVEFKMLGVEEDNLKKLVDQEIEGKIDKEKQVVLSYGFDTAVFRLQSQEPDGGVRVAIQTVVEAGPQLDAEAIKREILGKKKGEVSEIIMQRPGIKEVKVEYSPFWVYKTPKNPSKVKVIFETSNNGEGDQ